MTQVSAIVTPAGTPSLARATSGAVTGTWGAGQNRTTGNLLVAVVSAGGTTASAAALSTPAGWTQQAVISNTPTTANAWAAVYTKTALGADAAPAFTATLAGTAAMTCTLLELVAADTGTPAGQTAAYASGAGAVTLTAMSPAFPAGQVTSAPGGYAVTVFVQEAAAAVNTWNGPGVAWVNLANDGATSSVLHTAVDRQSGVAAGSAPAETGHWTTNTTAFGAAILAVFGSQTGAVEQFITEGATTISTGGTTAPAAGTPENWTAASWASFPAATNAVTTDRSPACFRVADPAAPTETILVLNTATGLVIRGADGTVPVTHTAGFTIQNVIGAGSLSGGIPPQVLIPPATGVAVTDSANIRAAIAAADAYGGKACFQGGTYQGDTGQFYVPQNVTLSLQQNTQWVLNCTGGAAVDALTVDNAGSVIGEGFGSGPQGGQFAQIIGGAAINCRALIANFNKTVQEFFYLSGLHISLSNGGTYAVAVVDLVNCYVNSGLRDMVIGCGNVNTGVPGLRLAGPGSYSGPVYAHNCWVLQSGGDGCKVDGLYSVWLTECTFEHPANGFQNLLITGGAAGVYVNGIHLENDTVTTPGPTALIKIDNAFNVNIVNAMTSAVTANKYGVWVTSADNRRISVRNFFNNNGVSPVLQDDSIAGGLALGGNGHIYAWDGPSGSPFAANIGSLQLGGDLRLGAQSVALASTAVDPRNGSVVDVAALAAGVTVAVPLNPQANQMLVYKFVQNGTGGFAVAWNAVFRVAAGVVSVTASKASTVAFRYDASLTAWVQLWASTGV